MDKIPTYCGIDSIGLELKIPLKEVRLNLDWYEGPFDVISKYDKVTQYMHKYIIKEQLWENE